MFVENIHAEDYYVKMNRIFEGDFEAHIRGFF